MPRLARGSTARRRRSRALHQTWCHEILVTNDDGVALPGPARPGGRRGRPPATTRGGRPGQRHERRGGVDRAAPRRPAPSTPSASSCRASTASRPRARRARRACACWRPGSGASAMPPRWSCRASTRAATPAGRCSTRARSAPRSPPPTSGCRGLAVSIDVAARAPGPRHWATRWRRVAADGRLDLAGRRRPSAPCSTSTCPTCPSTRCGGAAGPRWPRSAPCGPRWSSRRRTAGGCSWSCAAATVELPPDTDTALVNAGYVAVTPLAGIQADRRRSTSAASSGRPVGEASAATRVTARRCRRSAVLLAAALGGRRPCGASRPAGDAAARPASARRPRLDREHRAEGRSRRRPSTPAAPGARRHRPRRGDLRRARRGRLPQRPGGRRSSPPATATPWSRRPSATWRPSPSRAARPSTRSRCSARPAARSTCGRCPWAARPRRRGAGRRRGHVGAAPARDVRRDFVANISHELKTPVGALALLAETLLGEDDPDVMPAPGRAHGQRGVPGGPHHRRPARAVAARGVAGQVATSCCRSRVFVGEAVDRVRPGAERRGIDLDVERRARQLTVQGDRRQLVSARRQPARQRGEVQRARQLGRGAGPRRRRLGRRRGARPRHRHPRSATSSGSSSASTGSTGPAAARRAAPGSAWPSCATWPPTTGATSRSSRARARARASRCGCRRTRPHVAVLSDQRGRRR